MSVHQTRPRALFLDDGQPLPFPGRAHIEIIFVANPGFGGQAPPGQTAPIGPTRMQWDANIGRGTVVPERPMPEIEVQSLVDDCGVHVSGTRLTLDFDCPSRDALLRTLTEYRYLLPTLLNVDFYDAPVVYSINGSIDEVPFTWQVAQTAGAFDITTVAIQQEKVERALTRLTLLTDQGLRRIRAALAYYHRACRLADAGLSPSEFMGEAILNLAKCLQVLFPGANGQEREAVRRGLDAVGIPQEEVEAWFVPAMILRDQVDVAHIQLAAFSSEEAETLQVYSEQALRHFRELLQRVVSSLENGSYAVPPYQDHGLKRDTAAAVAKLRENLTRSGV